MLSITSVLIRSLFDLLCDRKYKYKKQTQNQHCANTSSWLPTPTSHLPKADHERACAITRVLYVVLYSLLSLSTGSLRIPRFSFFFFCTCTVPVDVQLQIDTSSSSFHSHTQNVTLHVSCTTNKYKYYRYCCLYQLQVPTTGWELADQHNSCA